jgi:hypothetical protein
MQHFQFSTSQNFLFCPDFDQYFLEKYRILPLIQFDTEETMKKPTFLYIERECMVSPYIIKHDYIKYSSSFH